LDVTGRVTVSFLIIKRIGILRIIVPQLLPCRHYIQSHRSKHSGYLDM